MVQFLYLTGEFATVAEVIAEMPGPIETGYTVYEHPRQLLTAHLDHLHLLEELRAGYQPPSPVRDEAGNPVDGMTAWTSLINQRIMEDELAVINSLLCEPCGCTLCCTGPEKTMEQEFFEIPLKEHEADIFAIDRYDTPVSRRSLSSDSLEINGSPFYCRSDPQLIHWQNGWSLILPVETSCPGLAADGRCQLYASRPVICRKPQIFSYILEQDGQNNSYMLRNSLLAVIDCPYVKLLQEEIGAYAAACELDFVLKENKK